LDVAKGFIIQTLSLFLDSFHAKEAETKVFPIFVSVPVMNTPESFSNNDLFVFNMHIIYY